MPPDWLLLVLLFVGIALVPLYEPLSAMTPLEYLSAGLANLLQSVGAFFGLLLLAILLLVSGGVLLAGYENVKARLGSGGGQKGSSDELSATTSTNTTPAIVNDDLDGKTPGSSSRRPVDPLDLHYPPPPPQRRVATARTTRDDKRAMRPYRVAKSLHLGGDDKLSGLLLVIAALSLLWIIPSYLFSSPSSSSSSSSSSASGTGQYDSDPWTGRGAGGDARTSSSSPSSWSHRDAISNSKASQMVIGGIVFISLLLIFALMRPEERLNGKRSLVQDETGSPAVPQGEGKGAQLQGSESSAREGGKG